jgi:phosphoribosyl-ATP pyrophosphohydrolase
MNRIEQLYEAILAHRDADPGSSRTARLFFRGSEQIGKKLGEETVEVIVAYLKSDREGAIRESADVLYHLAVLWAELGVTPSDIWQEMDRRVAMTGLAGKLSKTKGRRLPAKNAPHGGRDRFSSD